MEYIIDGDKIRKIMIDRNIDSILELSELTGIGRDTLSRVIKGKIRPSSEVMYKLAGGLKIPPQEAGEIFFAVNLLNT